MLLGRSLSTIDSDCESVCSAKPKRNIESRQKVQTISTQCDILPSFIIDNEFKDLDLDDFKDTVDAPNVHWKGYSINRGPATTN